MSIPKRAGNAYGETPEALTPYQKAQAKWDERIGSSRVQAKNWRLMAFLCLTLLALFAAMLTWQSVQSKVTPYVVEVETLGTVRNVGPAEEAYIPSDAQIAFTLSQFIKNTRSVSIDPIILRENWEAAYAYATDRAAATLTEYARTNDPFADFGERSVTVEITSVVRASDTSFQIKWVEQHFRAGILQSSGKHTAILSIVIQQPHDLNQLRLNPLGIYVHGLNWSADVKTGENQ